jgi:predicted Zn-dependent peptidase
MLTEGTARYRASQIAEVMDSVGAHLETAASLDFTTITLYALDKHLPKLLPVVHSLLTEPAFPEDEFNTLRNIKRQRLRIDETKNSILATRTFRKKLFGNHPYGRYLVPDDLDNLSPDVLKNYFYTNVAGQTELFIAGGISDKSLALVDKIFGNLEYDPDRYSFDEFDANYVSEDIYSARKDSVQSSLRIGKPLFTMRHPDYHRFSVMNTLLGGYFGSRLMKVIREEKGYTYGIYSSLNSLKSTGYFAIGADVVGEATQQAIDEIYNQIELLRKVTPSQTEVETVQNYMVGTFLGSLNTPFAIADKYKNLYFNRMPLSFYADHVKQIYNTDAEQVQELAQKYLNPNEMLTVAVGCVPKN